MKTLKTIIWIQLFLLTVLGTASLLVRYAPPANETTTYQTAGVDQNFQTVSSR